MAKSKQTALRADESERDSFHTLMHRFLMAIGRLKLASKALARGEDYDLASCVVEEVTEALIQIRKDFERWDNMDREHTPKSKVVQS